MSIYAPEELLNQTDFALEVAKNVLEFYEEYYGIRYPMNKSGSKRCLAFKGRIPGSLVALVSFALGPICY